MMRVVVDARPLSHPQAGGFRSHVAALVRGLAERAAERAHDGANADLDLILYVDRPLPPVTALSLSRWATVRVLHSSRLRTDFALFARQVKSDSPDLVHGTMNYLPPGLRARQTLTLHDALGIKSYPWDAHTPRTPRERFINRYWASLTKRSARRANALITVSHSAQREIENALPGLPPAKTVVIYNGIAPFPLGRPIPPRDDNTVLLIESPDPRKNVALVYRALSESKAAAPSLRLEVVCSSEKAADRARTALEHYQIENARLFCRLSDVQMQHAYAHATIFAWPSRAEGFGLPPLEAMQTGAAVVSSPAPAMPEILGDVPRYADPDDAGAWAEALAALLASPGERAERGARGAALASTFTCRRMANETVTVWEKAAR